VTEFADASAATFEWVLARLSRAYDELEARTFDVAGVFPEVPTLTMFGKATAVAELSRRASELLANAEDVAILPLRMEERHGPAGEHVLDLTVCLLWSPRDAWIDHEREVDVTVVLSADGSRAAAVVVGPPTPEDAPFPPADPLDRRGTA
jgi:hypothetical protein